MADEYGNLRKYDSEKKQTTHVSKEIQYPLGNKSTRKDYLTQNNDSSEKTDGTGNTNSK